LAGLACLLAALPLIVSAGLPVVEQGVLAMAAALLPVVAIELARRRVHRAEAAGLAWDERRRIAWGRVGTKLVGLLATYAAIGFVYWLFREYQGTFYRPFWQMIVNYFWIVVLASVPYFAFVDARMREPHDAYWQLGAWLLGRRGVARRADLIEHARLWLIKGFFIPLFFVYLTHGIGEVDRAAGALARGNFASIYVFLWHLMSLVDLAFATGGLIVTLRLIDGHARATDGTALGWVACLACFQPAWSFLYTRYLGYEGDMTWGPWLEPIPLLYVAWGSVILALTALFTWSTVVFGYRFSQLAHRGIVTNGPYRLTKHPAYVAKNLSWWLISIPWLPTLGTPEAVRNCALLLLVNYIHVLRARAEERLLSQDPDYVAYALWIDRHGAFAWVGRLLPFLRYRPPVTAASEAPATP
jgi:hypothetical protein